MRLLLWILIRSLMNTLVDTTVNTHMNTFVGTPLSTIMLKLGVGRGPQPTGLWGPASKLAYDVFALYIRMCFETIAEKH